MPSPYDKIDTSLKEIYKIKHLIEQGVCTIDEKEKAIQLAKDASDLFTDEILKRKAYQLKTKTVWHNLRKSGNPYIDKNEVNSLDPWIKLLEEHKNKRKIKSELSSDKIHIQSVVDGKDQHLFITEKGTGEHSHLIIDHITGEIRIDPKDQKPHDLITSIEAKLTLKTGEGVQVTRTSLDFTEPKSKNLDIKVYPATKDGYNLLEVYNSGNEDLEKFEIKISWEQPEGKQDRILTQFNEITDNLVMSHARLLNVLKIGERVYAINIPGISVDKKIKVSVVCVGVNSGEKIKKFFELDTPNQYK